MCGACGFAWVFVSLCLPRRCDTSLVMPVFLLCSLQRRGRRMYLHGTLLPWLSIHTGSAHQAADVVPLPCGAVMWRYLEQQSFPLTEDEYDLQLDAVASYLNLWQAQDTVRSGIQAANKRGPGFTGGSGARAISIPLGVDVGGDGRSDEWDSY